MSILVVDDSDDTRLLIETILSKAGHKDVLTCSSVSEALKILEDREVDLILMDVLMPEIDGIEACRLIKRNKDLLDIPIIMVTAKDDMEYLQQAFSAGALDYITKPFNRIELLARVRSALKLKQEMDKRKARERELEQMAKALEEANERLKRLSSLDGLTGIANRRVFDETLEAELKRAKRQKSPISLILIDVDYFKLYNDSYGHIKGDECLKKIADVLSGALKRAGDLAARYGGEEFACILANTDVEGALGMAEKICAGVRALKIPHERSPFGIVTVSIGIASLIPSKSLTVERLINCADTALYRAKRDGKNQIKVYREELLSVK
ncbi:MAG: diguanylate cyclase [Nitrospirae bacterium]|nr:MAG: diguanylate cyclase [Nitrospirota bacterium]